MMTLFHDVSFRDAPTGADPESIVQQVDWLNGLRARAARAPERRGGESLVRVTCRQIARDLRAFLDVAADRDGGGGRAAPVGLLKAVIATVEAGDHAGAALAGGGFGVDQRLHLAAPFVALVGPADAAQIVQPAEDLRQPLQIAVKWRTRV